MGPSCRHGESCGDDPSSCPKLGRALRLLPIQVVFQNKSRDIGGISGDGFKEFFCCLFRLFFRCCLKPTFVILRVVLKQRRLSFQISHLFCAKQLYQCENGVSLLWRKLRLFKTNVSFKDFARSGGEVGEFEEGRRHCFQWILRNREGLRA